MWLVYTIITPLTVLLFIVCGKIFTKRIQTTHQYPTYGATQIDPVDLDSEYYADNKNKTETSKSDLTQHCSSTYEYPTRELAFMQLNNHHEPHYDIPHLSNTYTSPLDEISNCSYNPSSINTKKNFSKSSTTASVLSESGYYQISESSTLPISEKMEMRKDISTCGGILSMDKKYGIALLLPEKTENGLAKNIMLSLLKNENFEWRGATIVSPFVLINEKDTGRNLKRPAILRIPHCMIDIKSWKISLYFSKNFDDPETNVKTITWCKITTVNEEDINTPVFLQIQKNHVNIATETVGKFVLVGSSVNANTTPACKSMKLMFFSSKPLNGALLSRVYVVNNLYDSVENCMKLERNKGAKFLSHANILIFDNNKDVVVQLKFAQSKHQTQTILLDEIWHSSANIRLPHCDFTIDLNEFSMDTTSSTIKIVAYQDKNDELATMCSVIPMDLRLNSLWLGDHHSNPQLPNCSQLIVTHNHSASVPLINSINRMHLGNNRDISGNLHFFSFMLNNPIRLQICLKLDPPTEIGNDWRLFARKLNADHYLPYFASKPSPTNVLLDFWELKNWYAGANTLSGLINIFISMNREDVAALIENDKTPTWI